jgi:hypothetical protein
MQAIGRHSTNRILQERHDEVKSGGFPAQRNHDDDEGEDDDRQQQVLDRDDCDDADASEVYDPGGLSEGQASCTKEG